MAVLQLTFKNVPADLQLTIEPEDIEYARDIGILTPREVVPTDFVPAVVPEPRVPTWASKASDGSGQDRHDQHYKKLMADIDFLKLQASQEADSHEEMLDDLGAIWEADLDGSIFDPSEPFGHKACRREILPSTATEVVRVIADKGHFLLGSIAGQSPTVYIPKDVIPEIHQHWNLNAQTFYLMDLQHTPPCPGVRNPWRATKVYPKLSTGGMLDSVLVTERTDDSARDWGMTDCTTTTFKLPMAPEYIGAMIGKGGQSVNRLVANTRSTTERGSWGDPEITILPDGEGSKVIFHEGHAVTDGIMDRIWWHPLDVKWLVNHLHC